MTNLYTLVCRSLKKMMIAAKRLRREQLATRRYALAAI